ncbi:OmpH family outer membrane protein [Fulvivirga ulvae]|uniref:OmpH family outer membrane protein n=1 Tax=Fulvivirga ulvae TaxID=2904245 RepID=UPI001F242679|nr:OmpH family outer membrane protein [Fulvivirga ulvae]UII31275.1 OmpH family outer membrane protein [Fulvivirga ulvae]
MANDKFNWKSLFINEEEPKESKPEKEESRVRTQPQSNSSQESSKSGTKFPEHAPKSDSVDKSILDTIVEMYEAGFDSLNRPGYDFYEFFKAIKAVGSNEPQVYKMALTMAQGVDNKVNKDTLLTQANFYINEIEKVHKQYQAQGNTKKTELQNTQATQKENLTTEITALEKQLMEIQNKISARRNELQSLDANLMAEVEEIDQKIIANDKARTKILETITTVVDGIKNHI